jgi:hypothetical protein
LVEPAVRTPLNASMSQADYDIVIGHQNIDPARSEGG